MSYGGSYGESRDDGQEALIADPFIRSCVRGLQKWVRSLNRGEIQLWSNKPPYYKIAFGEKCKPIQIQWYFHGGKNQDGRFIHFELPKSTADERNLLKTGLSPLSEQPYIRKPRKGDRFTFNVYNASDLELAKAVIIERFNNWARTNGLEGQPIGSHTMLTEARDRVELDSASPADLKAMTEDEPSASENEVRVSPFSESGQGFETSAVVRKEIERWAMQRATTYFQQDGWIVEDVSMFESFDLRCSRPGQPDLHVEVKGTRSGGDRVLLTANEVAHARNQYPNMALYVLSNVRVESSTEVDASASGGDEIVYSPWLMDDAQLRPITYEYLTSGT